MARPKKPKYEYVEELNLYRKRVKDRDYLMEELNITRENYVLPISLHNEEADYHAAATALAKGAEILLSTEDNRVVIGPVPATEVYQFYPVSFYPAG